MKKKNLSKLIALGLLSLSLASISPKEVDAASWVKDRNGWWYSEGNSWATGWRYINGSWYYFNSQGYMAHDTVIDGYYVNSNGQWVTSSPATPTKTGASSTVQNGVSNTNSTTDIGEEKAKQIAFNHAGLSSTDISYVTVSVDYIFGFKSYDIDFKYGNKEYDYDIEASTGRIIKYDTEIDDDYINIPQNSTSSIDIGLEKAKQIAFNHAGVSSNSIRDLDLDYDYNNGVKVYEISFKVGNIEYDYDINSLTGAIEKYDKEYDD